jgi:HJR/Mrr/RecB family endonuclease
MTRIVLIDDNKDLTDIFRNNISVFDKEINSNTLSFDKYELSDYRFQHSIEISNVVIISHAVIDWHKHTGEKSRDLIKEIKHYNSKIFIVTFSGRGNPITNLGDLFITRNELYNSIITKQWMEQILNFYVKNSTLITTDVSKIINTVSFINRNLIQEFASNPEKLYQLSPYLFEEFVASLFELEGYKILLTPKAKDGGKDIYAYKTDDFTNNCYVVECKRYNPNNKIGVPIIRQLYGVIAKENVSGGIIVTTSYYTQPAQEFVKDIPHQLFLKDFTNLKSLLIKYKK